MSSGIHRKRLACVECTRRKVKCDKILPCRNCTRKGVTCTRPRERNSPSPNAAQPERHVEPRSIVVPRKDATIFELQSRIIELETALKESKKDLSRLSLPRPEPSVTESPFSPIESLSTQQSPFSVLSSPQTNLDSTDTPREVEDAATILEFLAWGRRKDPTYQDQIARESNINHSPGDVSIEDEWEDGFKTDVSIVSLCEALLPSKEKVYKLVQYHCDCLLWYHGSFHAQTLLSQLNRFYERQEEGCIEETGASLQWIALLFAVLTGSMATAPRSISQSWGFRDRERKMLSRRWLKATITCLHQADYMARHSIFSVQAIAALTISVHMLGHSNGFSVLLASAVRIAQGLGLHQLEDKGQLSPSNTVTREIGRRVWCQLCIQDWFSIPFTESYLVHRLSFSTPKPLNCDDDIQNLSNDQPSVTSYSRLFYEIAALMPGLQDDSVSSNTLYTKYEEVIKYDRLLRSLINQRLPRYLQNVSLDPSWPEYVPWARKCLAISSSHKIIMIHRKFLGLSFTNPMFEFTRKTCVAASRTIIKEQKEATRDGGPVLWIHQAFSVTASIILCLDMFHQSGTDRQSSEHRELIEDGIEILSHCELDMIAQRGVFLLRAMLESETISKRQPPLSRMHQPSILPAGPLRRNGLDIADIICTFYKDDHASLPRRSNSVLRASSNIRPAENSHWSELVNFGPGGMLGADFAGSLGVDCVEGLDEILNLATNYLN